MNRKPIKTVDGIINMSLEEVLYQYDDMVKSFAHKCVKELAGYGAIEEFDDYYQTGQVELIELYNIYEAEKSCFSTMLHRIQHQKFIMMLRRLKTQKRKNDQTLLYLNDESEEGEIENVVGKKDVELENCEDSLDARIKKHFTEEEKLMIILGFKRVSSKIEGREKRMFNLVLNIFDDIDVGMDIKKLTSTDVAKILNISRPTLSKRVDKVMERLRLLALDYLGQGLAY